LDLSDDFKGQKMETDQDLIKQFRDQLKKGKIQKAYKLLLEFILSFRIQLKSHYPEWEIPGSIYHGYLDMTYFPVFTKLLKSRGLKIAVVFNYEVFQFELWLSAANKTLQKQYWEKLRNHSFKNYSLTVPAKRVDSILEYPVPAEIDFTNPEVLTEKLEQAVREFVETLEELLIGL